MGPYQLDSLALSRAATATNISQSLIALVTPFTMNCLPRISALRNLLFGVLGSLLLAACSDSGEPQIGEPLRFGAIPDEKGTDLVARFAPLSAYLSDELGVPVEFVPVDSYEGLIAQFKNGDVQLAWFGGLSGVQARAGVEGARAIAQGVVDPTFVSYFIANVSTGLEPGDEFPMGLKGHSFTFGSPNSTSGRLMPEHFIREASGGSPAEFFDSENNYSGGHDKTATLVQAGTFDAGALSYLVYDKLVASGQIDPEVCRKIWTTPTYVDYNWTAHPVLLERYGSDFIDRLQTAIVAVDSKELLTAMMRPDGFVPAANSDFAAIHDLAVRLEFVR